MIDHCYSASFLSSRRRCSARRLGPLHPASPSPRPGLPNARRKQVRQSNCFYIATRKPQSASWRVVEISRLLADRRGALNGATASPSDWWHTTRAAANLSGEGFFFFPALAHPSSGIMREMVTPYTNERWTQPPCAVARRPKSRLDTLSREACIQWLRSRPGNNRLADGATCSRNCWQYVAPIVLSPRERQKARGTDSPWSLHGRTCWSCRILHEPDSQGSTCERTKPGKRAIRVLFNLRNMQGLEAVRAFRSTARLLCIFSRLGRSLFPSPRPVEYEYILTYSFPGRLSKRRVFLPLHFESVHLAAHPLRHSPPHYPTLNSSV